MNVLWPTGCSAGNPDLTIPKFGECNEHKRVGIT
jgi:hypothetical protein